MDYNRIKFLLDKYWKCETSLEEEAELRKFFENGNIPEDLQPYSPLFRYFGSITELKPEEELHVPELNDGVIGEAKRDKSPEGKHRIIRQWFYRAAAAVILLVSVFIIHQQMGPVRKKAVELTKDTYSNPEQALQETRKMLMLISVKLNKGEAQAAKLYEFHEAEDLIRNKKQ